MVEKIVPVRPENFVDSSVPFIIGGYEITSCSQRFCSGVLIVFRTVRRNANGAAPVFEKFCTDGKPLKSDIGGSAVGGTDGVPGILYIFSPDTNLSGKPLIIQRRERSRIIGDKAPAVPVGNTGRGQSAGPVYKTVFQITDSEQGIGRIIILRISSG